MSKRAFSVTRMRSAFTVFTSSLPVGFVGFVIHGSIKIVLPLIMARVSGKAKGSRGEGELLASRDVDEHRFGREAHHGG